MKQQFFECFQNSRFLLTEGAIAERLKHEASLRLDPLVGHASLIYERPEILTKYYQQYISIAQRHDIPIMLMTPTRKVNHLTHKQSRYRNRNLIDDSCNFLKGLRDNNRSFADKIFIGGFLGCKGDAYNADDALGAKEAFDFHSRQVEVFKRANIDFLFAGTMPALSEALGMAQALSESELHYIMSLMIRKDGCLLDKTSVAVAISTIDTSVRIRPLCYMTNCIHPSNLKIAFQAEANKACDMVRFSGIQANASSLDPVDLNNSKVLHQEGFEGMISDMDFLVKKYKLKILGGCCGTNDLFLDKLAAKLRENML